VKINGAEIIVECLKEQKVDTVFGFPGGKVLHIYDALYKAQDKIRHVLTAHEQGASHMADGYSRATGKVGVCFATSGPGATNLVTGIATAYMDSVPMVAITGNCPVNLLGKDSFQEVDITGVTMPVTKHNYIVSDITKLADTIREAFWIAQEGRPGPVLVDIPSDIAAQTFEYEYKAPKPVERKIRTVGDKAFGEVVSLLREAQKPLIMAGGGVVRSRAAAELKTFVEKTGIPITCSFMGQGVFPCDHPLYTGMIGMHGTKVSNTAVGETDLLIVIGARFTDRVVSRADLFARNAKILHIDIDPAEINKNIRTCHHIVGDIKLVLEKLNKMVERNPRPEWEERIQSMKKEYPIRVNNENRRGKEIIETLSDLTQGKAIIATEVGQHQMWAAQFYSFAEPYTFISSGGLGTMGFGTGAAIGSRAGRPDKKVINIAGDGSFRMNFNELTTAVRFKLPVVILLLNNGTLGMVRQWQTLFYGKRYSATDLDFDINWIKLAEALGAKGFDLPADGNVKEVLKKALAEEGTVVVNCEIPIDDKVFPMVPPGKPVEEVLLNLDN
jgi:acetolactate synthase-1/2/3 large subunit